MGEGERRKHLLLSRSIKKLSPLQSNKSVVVEIIASGTEGLAVVCHVSHQARLLTNWGRWAERRAAGAVYLHCATQEADWTWVADYGATYTN